LPQVKRNLRRPGRPRFDDRKDFEAVVDGPHVTAYCVSLGLLRAAIWLVAGLLRDKHREVGTRKDAVS
jgi:hypothetical protein